MLFVSADNSSHGPGLNREEDTLQQGNEVQDQRSQEVSRLCCHGDRHGLMQTDLRGLVRQNSMWDKVVLKKVRSLLGGRVRMIFTGSAPIAAHVLDFLRAAFGCQVTCLHTIPPLTVEGEIF